MKRLNLFWKTWLITIITIFFSMTVFAGFLYISATFFITQQQQKLLSETATSLKQVVEKEGINISYLDSLYQTGILINIFENNNPIYPNNTAIVVEFSVEIYDSDEIQPSFEEDMVQNSTLFSTEYGTALAETFNVKYDTHEYEVAIFLPASNNQLSLFYNLLENLPEFILTALLVSSISAFLYARYFTKKIKHLNNTIDAMATRTLLPISDYPQGDEIQQLENNLFMMYNKLCQSVNQLETEIAYSKRLESDRSIFMKGATHELKTPIMIMNSMIEGMLEVVPGYENHEKYLQACYEELHRMTQLVQEILEVARLEHLKFTGNTDVAPIMMELLAEYSILLEDKDITLTIIATDTTNAMIDNRNIKKVLSNLLMNAIKYTPHHKEIQIELANNSLTIQNDTYQMADINLDKIINAFTSYQDVDQTESKGHGLGLYIVDYILTQYHIPYEYNYHLAEKKFLFKIFFE